MNSLLLDYLTYLESYWIFFVLILVCIIFSTYAQIKVNSSYNKYSMISSSRGLTAETVARNILDSAGLSDISVVRVSGHLSDYYHPKKKEIGLSSSVYGSSSVASIAIATHEVGHAIQHKKKNIFAVARKVLVPVCNIGSILMWPIIILGFILLFLTTSPIGEVFIYVGIGIFALSTLISIITVPLERDASRRAIKILQGSQILDEDEIEEAKAVLNSASLTYVAGMLTSMVYFLRFLIIILPRSRD